MGKETFDKKNIFEIKKMNIQEATDYYRRKRKYLYDTNTPIKGLKIRRIAHPLLLAGVKLDRKLSKEELEIIGDKREKTTRPKIYAATHIGGNDIQRTFESIKDHAYLFLGDPKDLYKDVAGLVLYANGVVVLDTSCKDDKKIAYNRAIELLKMKGNLLIYPEGAWNLTDNLAVMKLYKGTMSMAKETGADVIPVALEQYGNMFVANIGRNIKKEEYANLDVITATNLLRDELSTLKWEIWEQKGICKRENIKEEDKEGFYKFMLSKCSYGVTIDDIEKTRFHDPNVTPNRDDLENIKKLVR